MADVPGIKPPPLTSLARAEDRLSFLYVEHCVVNRDSNAVTITDKRGTVHVPAAILSAATVSLSIWASSWLRLPAAVSSPAMARLMESISTCATTALRSLTCFIRNSPATARKIKIAASSTVCSRMSRSCFSCTSFIKKPPFAFLLL